VLDCGRAEPLGSVGQQGLALLARIGQDAHLDEAMRAQRDVELLVHRRGQSIGADHHHRVEVMGGCAQAFALPGRELDRRHPRIIPVQ
jgi:hypothetical protein